ncbi:SpoIID/LytB domain-containing protein [Niameybacter sp.]|uniref:SpoIID/LytB domain-containing protein n=1 Tax=Niameybacter sp. TaxID=2033640 RepID=UPI002FCA6427
MHINQQRIRNVVGISALVIPMIAQAKAPDSIRIGLESVYKDATTVQIKSEEPLAIGYFEGERWRKEGDLDTSEVTVSLDSQTYYNYQEVYGDFETAYDALEIYDQEAVVAYIEPGEYKIYTTDDFEADEVVVSNAKRINVKDTRGEVVLVSENDAYPLGFRGGYNQYDFPATGVGNSRIYRGVIEVVKGQSKGLTAVNQVDMEEYLYGVVPCEVSASWHEEALKAQSVAARSMATFQYSRFLSRGYNLVDTTTSQVYRGITSEHDRTTAAVEATRGEVATYNGKVAETVYSASSGGYTADAKYVWGNSVPYLVAKPDPYETDHVPWKRTITTRELEKCVANAGKNIGSVESVRIGSYSQSGRVNELTILGTAGEYTVTKENTRTFFGGSNDGSLKSRKYQFTPYNGVSIPDVTIKPGTGGNNTDEVAILTSQGMVQLELEGLWMESEETYSKIRDAVYIKSAHEMITSDIFTTSSGGSFEVEGDYNSTSKPDTVYGDLTLYGYGYGHGVGMSQYGAKGMAEAGFSYKEIIEYYYEGVVVE